MAEEAGGLLDPSDGVGRLRLLRASKAMSSPVTPELAPADPEPPRNGARPEQRNHERWRS